MDNNIKIPVHACVFDDSSLIVFRQKEPRFKAIYQNGKLNIIEWLDEKPDEAKIISLLKKAEAFLKHEYFK